MSRPLAAWVRESVLLAAASGLLAAGLGALGPELVPVRTDRPAKGRILMVDTQGAPLDALVLRLDAWEDDFPQLVAAWRPGVPIRVRPSAKPGEAEAVARRLRQDLGFENVQVEVSR